MPPGSFQLTRRSWAVVGALAAAIALSFDWGLHRALVDVPFAPFALADRIVRVTPGSIATWMIDHLHHAAKALLAAGSVAVFIASGAGIAALLGRRPPRAAAVFGLLALLVGSLEPVKASAWGGAAGAVDTGSRSRCSRPSPPPAERCGGGQLTRDDVASSPASQSCSSPARR
jgi:hypothetical protein